MAFLKSFHPPYDVGLAAVVGNLYFGVPCLVAQQQILTIRPTSFSGFPYVEDQHVFFFAISLPFLPCFRRKKGK
jgi:hypothetical protein